MDGARRRDLLEKLKQSLINHGQIEQNLLYPALLSIPTDNASSRVHEALRDHRGIEAALTQLLDKSLADPLFETHIEQLALAVRRHVQDEETGLFVIARTRMSPIQLKELGYLMKDMRDTLNQLSTESCIM